MEKRLTIIGFIAVALGVVAVLLCIMIIFHPVYLRFALFAGFSGFIFTNIYLVLNAKFQFKSLLFNMGMLGLVLNSIPVLLILALKLYSTYIG